MSLFPAVRIEGGFFSADLLERLLQGELDYQRARDFGLSEKRPLTEEIAAIFADARAQWGVFQNRLARLPPQDSATSVTRDTWVVPLFSMLGYDLHYNSRPYQVEQEIYPISHRAGAEAWAPPVHIVGARQELGKVPPSGRPRLAPHSLLQQFLNRTEHLWGLVTNGLVLRVLRDCSYIRRLAYIEFDLARIFEEQLFLDFNVFYRLVHRTRLPVAEAQIDACPLEVYYRNSVEQGSRVRERLREGVEECLQTLANGFLRHPANSELRRRIDPRQCANASGEALSALEFYRDLLCLVYRLLFLLVCEDRGLLGAHRLYREHYGVSRFRRLVDRRSAYTDDGDLWWGLCLLWKLLADGTPCAELQGQPLASLLGLPVLDGELFDPIVFDECCLANRDLLQAVRHLIYYHDESAGHSIRRVNYAALDVEELGSVYESLLDNHPVFRTEAGSWEFTFQRGTQRKSTGSYYTPPELVQELVRSALEPILYQRCQSLANPSDKEKALLEIKVIDPACGSGHFLLAAARRLGKELARIRTGDEEPAPEAQRVAIRDVIAHCIFGVDKNPLAVQLCKLALWLESHVPHKPLTFLDHRIRCGDSLVGVLDWTVLNDGIPNTAFDPVSGDDPSLARAIRKANRQEQADRVRGQKRLLFTSQELAPLAQELSSLARLADDSPQVVRDKKQRFEDWHKHARPQRQLCDLYVAAFFQARDQTLDRAAVITTDTLCQFRSQGPALGAPLASADQLAQRLRFFHWPLEFPDVFLQGGFDVVLCNPPWELIQLEEQVFFATRDAEIATAANKAIRERLISDLPKRNLALWRDYQQALHDADALRKYLRSSRRFAMTSSGRINYYSVFAELFLRLLAPGGRAGVVIPSGIATDVNNREFFNHLVQTGQLVSLFDFENKEGVFLGVHRSYKFCLMTLRRSDGKPPNTADKTAEHESDAEGPVLAFFLSRARDLRDEGRRFALTAHDFTLINPNTRTCPIFRTRQDAELTKAIYRRVPVLVNEATGENRWGVRFRQGLFNMSTGSGLFWTQKQLRDAGYVLQGNRFVRERNRKDTPLSREESAS
ncbi:MAG: N-6 DNA methylase [Gemmatales bacterium]|nr:N-6 DNA methylase [Gemmatales bacterium]